MNKVSHRFSFSFFHFIFLDIHIVQNWTQMWIYSLGITLKQTISFQNPVQIDSDVYNVERIIGTQTRTSKSINGDINNYGSDSTTILSSLDKVIFKMCEPRSMQRASLMFLLDVSIMFYYNYTLLYYITFPLSSLKVNTILNKLHKIESYYMTHKKSIYKI